MASAKSGGQANMIKLAVAGVALTVGIGLIAWFVLKPSTPPPPPPAVNNPAPTTEQQNQMDQYRQNPPVPTETGSA